MARSRHAYVPARLAVTAAAPESPKWWLSRLALRLQDRRGDIDTLERMFTGDHPCATTSADDLEDFRTFSRLARSNYLALVVEAALERMRVTGIRAGAEDPSGDKVSWKLWQLASLDADQVLVHRTTLALRRAYVIVGPHPRPKSTRDYNVLITPEDPRDVITESWPEDRREVRAALKIKFDSVRNREMAWVYLPGGVYPFVGPVRDALTKSEIDAPWTLDSLTQWEQLAALPNPTPGEVPVVEFANRPGLKGKAVSEFEDVIDIQNRINATLLHRLVAEKFAVIRQRMILNMEFDEEEILDAEGNSTGETRVITPELPNDPRAVWLLNGEHLQFQESEQTSTADILTAVSADIRDLAAITRTPPHYLLNSIVNASGDALKSAETGLVSKVKEHIAQFSDSWERVMHLAHVVAKTDRAAADLEILWADPESRSLTELYDAASKAVVAGESWRARMELVGHSPARIDRMEGERLQDAFVMALQTSVATPPTPGGPDVPEEDDSADGPAGKADAAA